MNIIYKYSSLFLQNVMISIFNFLAYRKRYGGKYKEYRKLFFENRGLSRKELLQFQKRRFKIFLEEAKANSQYYSDLYKKSAIKFQNKYYWQIAIFFAFIIPLLLGAVFNRPWGGLLWGGIVRVTLVHHFTFFINSFCT